ncbi:MAG: (4Fe-4S)-binding protein [Deltaproteobacteria bacterium RBG_13_49_15]|nr:MAG: (4Fe-4S)-binding protein [Deltaproteobacteria bacterium RBG_13_49_15]
MKELVVISGKGGTGKTSLLAAFASLAANKVLCDADVDAADLHLIMDPQIRERHEFESGHKAIIHQDKCTQCGLCRELCRWEAITENFVVDPIECEGCGVCHYFCPEKAIDFPLNTCGEWFISDTRFGPMAHARLGIAEENSGKLVTLIRQEGKKLAEQKNLDLLLTDGPPGIGCPVIASLGGATAVFIVAEPTISGRHDMKRVAELAAFFKIPTMVCINKFDLNPKEGQLIEEFARKKNITVMGRIPFDHVFTRAMVQGKTIFEFDGHSDGSLAVEKIWNDLALHLEL